MLELVTPDRLAHFVGEDVQKPQRPDEVPCVGIKDTRGRGQTDQIKYLKARPSLEGPKRQVPGEPAGRPSTSP
jgi:hypothetical protein